MVCLSWMMEVARLAIIDIIPNLRVPHKRLRLWGDIANEAAFWIWIVHPFVVFEISSTLVTSSLIPLISQ